MSETLNETEQKAGHLCAVPLFVRQADTRLNFTVILPVNQMK
jgi:hypothetical protein